jgi:hypothetical protein
LEEVSCQFYPKEVDESHQLKKTENKIHNFIGTTESIQKEQDAYRDDQSDEFSSSD